jgi:hypothetical protein
MTSQFSQITIFGTSPQQVVDGSSRGLNSPLGSKFSHDFVTSNDGDSTKLNLGVA